VLREHLLRGYTIKQPVTLEHLQEMKQNLEYQIKELRRQIENLDVVTNEQYSELYHALLELTSQKKLIEEKPRRKIGFKVNSE
jgi:protein tyrosine phosphatase